MALMILADKRVRKGLLIGGGVLGLVLVGTSLAKGTSRKEQKNALDEIRRDRLARQKGGEKQTHSDDQLESWSVVLQQEFGKCGLIDPFERSWDRIEKLLKEMNTTVDVKRLNEIFDSRKVTGPWICFNSGRKKTLSELVSEKLFPQQKKRINKVYADRNIDWRWL